jgi:hypothetical protein
MNAATGVRVDGRADACGVKYQPRHARPMSDADTRRDLFGDTKPYRGRHLAH